ncbi:superoxide dismutase family protein [Streptomyces sp. enrichment culture]|uniref:superoxide dismutase family protein n=1 Tax=Streptomyces sp. enrichment culture TaxID=1795815 RepID=UPI003F55161A
MVAGICAGAVAAALLVAGSGGVDGHADGYRMSTSARFAPPTAFVPSAAITYDMGLVPAGAWIQVTQRTEPLGATTVRLRVKGMQPGHRYGVHVHQKPCAADPDAAGGHYQHEPGTGEHHVTAENEVWLDFTPDRDGTAEASAHHGWGFRRGEASSVVIHDEPGSKGARVGCFTVPFGWVTGTG